MIDQYKTIGARYSHIKEKPSVAFTEVPSVLRLLEPVHSLNVIDIACGTGFYSRRIKQLGARRVLGVDLSNAMIEAARDEEAKNPSGIEYIVSDIESLSIVNEFNVANASWLLNYATSFDHLDRMCVKIGKSLKKGGRLVAVVPNPRFNISLQGTELYGYRTKLLNFGRDIPHVMMEFLQDPPFVIEYRQWSFIHYENALISAGFSNIECHEIPVSEEGIEKMGRDYWLVYEMSPIGIIITAEYMGDPFLSLCDE